VIPSHFKETIMTTETQQVPLDRMASAYIKIRSRIAELTKAYDTEVEALKAEQDEVAAVMKDMLQAMHVRSVNTAGGTVILTEKTRYFPSDWTEFKNFVKENDLFDLVEKRIAQGNMAKYLADLAEAKELRNEAWPYPAGMQSETELTVSVRKPTSGK
jgi:hypothetical protein